MTNRMLARNLMVGPPPQRLDRQYFARCDARPFAFDIRDRQLAGVQDYSVLSEFLAEEVHAKQVYPLENDFSTRTDGFGEERLLRRHTRKNP